MNEFGLPVVSRSGEKFPNQTFVAQQPVMNMTVASNNKTVLRALSDLQEGQLYFMAVMPPPDDRIKQKVCCHRDVIMLYFT